MKSLGSLREEGERVQPGGLERGKQTAEDRTWKVAASAFSPLWMGPLQSLVPRDLGSGCFSPMGRRKDGDRLRQNAEAIKNAWLTGSCLRKRHLEKLVLVALWEEAWLRKGRGQHLREGRVADGGASTIAMGGSCLSGCLVSDPGSSGCRQGQA